MSRYFFWPLLAMVLLPGCGRDDGPVRVPLEGIVSSLDVPKGLNGTISLMPSSETKGPAANGLIRDGLYKFTMVDGPVSGTHRVLIDVEPPRQKMDRAAAQSAPQWKFEFQITVPAEAPFEHDFTLTRESDDAESTE